MQERYWNFMTQLKFVSFYLDEHFSSSIDVDRKVNMFLAVTSSSSIAAWAIWSHLNFLWAIIIAASQVITAIKEFLPYKKRIESITDLKSKLSPICDDMEYNWYKVCNGEFTEGEINDFLHKIKIQQTEAESKAFPNDYLPEKDKFKSNAEEKKNDYFKKF